MKNKERNVECCRWVTRWISCPIWLSIDALLCGSENCYPLRDRMQKYRVYKYNKFYCHLPD